MWQTKISDVIRTYIISAIATIAPTITLYIHPIRIRVRITVSIRVRVKDSLDMV